jgi:hypothetical protein
MRNFALSEQQLISNGFMLLHGGAFILLALGTIMLMIQ